MKKNLRIVSVAAAALLAVAPVAASAVSTVSAADATTTTTATTTNKPTIDLTGAGAVTNAADTVTVTPNFTLTAAVAKDKKVTASATLQGTITASLNGTSVTANVIDAAKDVTLKSNTGYTTIYKYDATTKTTENNLGKWNEATNDVYVKAGNDYQVELTGVGFSFGSANANKELSLKLPSNVTVTGAAVNGNKLKLDQYGNVTNLTFTVKGIKAYDATNTSAVQFYNTNSGLIESKAASYMALADNNGNLNVNTLLDGLKKQYKAVQLQNGELKDVNVTTTAADLTAELEKAGIFTPNDPNSAELLLWYRPNKSISTTELHGMLEDLEKEGKQCVLLVLDYLKRIRSSRPNKELRLELGQITDELNTIAKDLEIPILTAQQLNREAYKSVEEASTFEAKLAAIDKMGASNVGESIDIVQNVDYGIILNRVSNIQANEEGAIESIDNYLSFKLIACRGKQPPFTTFTHRFRDGNSMALVEDWNFREPTSVFSTASLSMIPPGTPTSSGSGKRRIVG